MKHIFNILLILVVLFILSCSRDWNNPFETDSDLSHPPAISNIELNDNHLELSLDYSYSDDCTVLFERKRTTAFEPVTLIKVSASVFADTTLDMEQNYNLVYRLRVQKNGYTSDYSPEKQFSYISNVINAPSGLSCSSIEIQGVRLNWTDNSSKETGYIIEKNVNGSGFAEAADLPANTTTWLDAISGMPDPPQSIIYRIRAYNTTLNSGWAEQNVIYSGLGAPSNLHITNSHFWEFTIAWTRNSTIATGYQIERKKDSGTWSVVGSVGASTSIYTEMVLENGSYDYRVKAITSLSYSIYSNIVSNAVNIIIPTNGLVAYYPFNGNSNDQSGNEYNGTANGATYSHDRFLQSNKAAHFDGDDYISIPNNNDFTAIENQDIMTLSVWAYVENWWYIDQWHGFGLLDKYKASNDYGWILWLNSLNFNFQTAYSGGTAANVNIPINQWIFFTLRNDLQTNETSFFVNGNLVDAQTSDFYPIPQTEGGNLYIGYSPSGGDDYSIGLIDDIRIYNRALTIEEIRSIYHEGGWTGN